MKFSQRRQAAQLSYAFLLAVLLALGAAFAQRSPQPLQAAAAFSSSEEHRRLHEAYGKRLLSFEANEGQTDPAVKFLARGPSHGFFLTQRGATLQLQTEKKEAVTLQMRLAGAHPAPQLTGEAELPGKSHYLVGSDQSKWRRNVANYEKIRYREVYPGIDLVFYGNQRQLEYDFVVSPGADPKLIKLDFDGARRVRIEANGELTLETAAGEIRQRRPSIYQTIQSARRAVAGEYVKRAERSIGFRVAAYDRTQPLVIDPVLVYAVRGFGGERIAVDAQGNAYLTGTTAAAFLPANLSPQREIAGETDLYVAKLNAAGTTLLSATYFGGNGKDAVTALALDVAGNIYLAGTTSSSDLPAAVSRPTDAVLFKSVDGGNSWQPLRNGLPNSEVRALAVGAHDPQTVYAGVNGRGLVFKSTDGGASWRAANGGLPTQPGGCDPLAVNILFSEPADALKLQAYVNCIGTFETADGGAAWRQIERAFPPLAVDPVNPAIRYFTQFISTIEKSADGGKTWTTINTGLPFSFAGALAVDPRRPQVLYLGALESGNSLADILFRSADGGLTWRAVGTGLPRASVRGLLIDPRDSNVLYLNTSRGLYRSANGGSQWTLAQAGLPLSEEAQASEPLSLAFEPGNSATLYAGLSRAHAASGVYKSTDGGRSWTRASNKLFNSDVRALLAAPGNPPTLYAGVRGDVRPLFGGGATDAFVAKLAPTGASVSYSAYLGGSGVDAPTSLAVDMQGQAYVAGSTDSADFPTTLNAAQTTGGGTQGKDAFLAKLASNGALVYASFYGGSANDEANGLALGANGQAYLVGTTASADLPIKNARQTTFGGGASDAFVARFDTMRTGAESLVYASYLGGTNMDAGRDIAVDVTGQMYALGQTLSPEFPTTPGVAQTRGTHFLAKLNAAGSQLIYATRLGTPDETGYLRNDEAFTRLALDAAGNLYLAGFTASNTFPITPDAVQPYRIEENACRAAPPRQFMPCHDAFLQKLNPAATALLYSTYFGGWEDDRGRDLAVDTQGAAYLTGTSRYADTPTTPGALAEPLTSNFIAKFNLDGSQTVLRSVSAASFKGPLLATESIVAGFGNGLATTTQAATGVLPTELGGVSLRLRDGEGNERRAPLFFVSPRQINYQIPPGIAGIGGLTALDLYQGETRLATTMLIITTVCPGLFAANADGRGVPAAVVLRVKPDGAQSFEPVTRFDAAQNRFVAVPIELGAADEQVFLILFGTGFRYRSELAMVKVLIGGVEAPVSFAGAQGGLVGLDQLNVQLPRALAGRGELELQLTVDSESANAVRINVR